MKRKLLVFAAVMILLIAALCASAFAAEVVASGKCGENVTWTLDSDGVLTISGEGEMEDFDNTPMTFSNGWRGSTDKIKSIIIENGITYIGEMAFSGCFNAERVQIAESVKCIGKSAFYGCTLIEQIVLPNNLEEIRQNAFTSCRSLQNITIPASTNAIGDGVFSFCTSLTAIKVDANNLYYSSGADGILYNKDMTELVQYPSSFEGEYIIPEGITAIRAYAFSESKLESIVISGNVTVIDNYTFYGCSSLKNVVIPDSITTIGLYAFMSCGSLEQIIIPASVKKIGAYSFANCKKLNDHVYFMGEAPSLLNTPNNGGLHEYIYGKTTGTAFMSIDPQSYTYGFSRSDITGNSFWNLFSVENGEIIAYGEMETINPGSDFDNAAVNCGDNIRAFLTNSNVLILSGTGAMNSYSSSTSAPYKKYGSRNEEIIERVIITDGITSIGSHAFSECSSLTNITLPESVKTIYEKAFYKCESLSSVTILNNEPIIKATAFSECDALLVNNIEFQGMDKQPMSLSDNGVLTIFSDVVMLTTYDYSYGDQLWYSQRNDITSVVIDEAVTAISPYAFGYMNNLKSVSIPETVSEIGEAAFARCYSLENVSLPKGVTAIESGTFYECSSLKNITISNNTTFIGKDAFSGCSSLEEILLPNTVATIGSNAFSGCETLESVTLPYSLTAISWGTFFECSSLKQVKISRSVSEIEYAFYKCESLEGFYVDENNIYFSNDSTGVLFNKDKTILIQSPGVLEEYDIPEGVIEVGNYAFDSSPYLEKVAIPNGVTYIGDYAFDECELLVSIILPSSMKEIGESAFRNCLSLESITVPINLTKIGLAAFYHCSSLEDVYYTGNEEQWKAIMIGDFNNPLINATIHYDYVIPADHPLGDIDGNGEVENSDLVTIARYIVGLTEGDTTTAVEAYADMNGDGKVDNSDIVTVARKIVGLA